MDSGLAGKGVLVTGGAGGIGSAITSALAAEGATVCVHYHSSAAKALELAQASGGIALGADLTNEREVDELFAAAIDRLGRLDVLVANAGWWWHEEQPLWEISLERWRKTIAGTLDTVFLSCRAFLRHVADTGTGNIVIISSTAGTVGEAGYADYATVKGGLSTGFVKSLKNEIVKLAPKGRVNVVAPGWTVVDRTKHVLEDEGFVDRVTKTMPLRKLGVPDDVARAVVFLASDELAGHVSGELIHVAGGMEGRVLHD